MSVADDKDTDPAKRIRIHTEKGENLYRARKEQYWSKCDTAWKKVEDILANSADLPVDLKAVRTYEKELIAIQDSYFSISTEFEEYLRHTCTSDSLEELEKHLQNRDCHKSILCKVFDKIKNLKEQALETLSVGSGKSSVSDLSSMLQRKRAKAEAQRARLEYVKKQAQLMKEKALLQEEERKSQASSERRKAELDANLHVLKQEEDIAAVEAEAHALEDLPPDKGTASLTDSTINRVSMTEAYVRNQRDIYHTPSPPRTCPHPTPRDHGERIYDHGHSFHCTYPDCEDMTYAHRDIDRLQESNLDRNQESVVNGLTQFLLKKDLVLSRFTNFDDQPEHYSTWKASFRSIIKELNVQPFDEMDLLVKYLGPTSANSAQSLRAANVADPDRGVRMIWERLEDRYGRPEMIESALKSRLDSFPKLHDKDFSKLYELTDILSQIESSKKDPQYSTLLSYYDSSSGVIPIVRRLPSSIQGKWTTRASKYKKDHMVSFPPFSYFVEFIREMSTTYNDPGFMYDTGVTHPFRRNKDGQGPHTKVSVRKSNISHSSEDTDPEKICPYHGSAKHPLSKCKGFRAASFEDKRKLLKNKHICFRCCKSTEHIARSCTETIKCKYCGSSQHASPMHIERSDDTVEKDVNSHGGEHTQQDNVSAKCTILCGNGFLGRSCSKTLLVSIFPNGQPERAVNVYAIIDDQADRTLVKSDLLDSFGDYSEPLPYTLESCSGSFSVAGRRARGYSVQSFDGSSTMVLPEMIECNDIPNVRSEIATPEVANLHPHLRQIADKIPPLDNHSEIQILIGRDLVQAHQVDRQIVGTKDAPFAQKLKLGWVIIGEVCLGKVHKPSVINVKRTHILSEGRETLFDPCMNSRQIKVSQTGDTFDKHDDLGVDIFQRTKDDNKVGLSVEDRAFVHLMDRAFHKDSNGHWSAPLPFRTPKLKMPNNRDQALKRAKSLHHSLQTNPAKKLHMVTFMEKIIKSGSAEVAPPLEEDREYWYLPLFGVYHPKKPDHIRGVFDSSAVHDGVSLNSVLMSGPDFMNSLLGILLRFRKNEIALTADIEQMFYQFFVDPEYRNYLRFFWYEQNDPGRPLIEYHMCVHVFGNKPSPAVASYGLRKTVENCDALYGSDVREFVCNNFYVDDGLISLSSPDDVIDLVKRTQQALKTEGNIRLHKIASNSSKVMEAFPPEDLGKDLKTLDFEKDYLPVQRSLGLAWDLNSDSFIFDIPVLDKPFTRRGLLSTVNSIYDPIGFLAPLTIMGKILLREATPSGVDWDSPLSPEHRETWQQWQLSLETLRDVKIPRMYFDLSFSKAGDLELHIFSDASEKAVAAVAYLCASSTSTLSFVLGKAKLAPSGGHTIPRLELCGAVLAVELQDLILEYLDINPFVVKFYTDSKVVLGYIANDTRRFYTYVANRVERIRNRTSPLQWNYIPTHLNPADSATRYAISDVDSRLRVWLRASSEVKKYCQGDCLKEDSFSLVDPDDDREIRCKVEVLKTSASVPSLGISRFENFLSWSKLVKAVSLLRHLAQSFRSENTCHGWHYCSSFKSVDTYREAEIFILKEAQRDSYKKEVKCLRQGLPLPKSSRITSLTPFLDNEGLLRLGGRLNKANNVLDLSETNPVILPKGHVSSLLIRHFHELVKHQGRHFTEGALRSNGYWVVGAKRTVSSVIHKCITCRKLRGKRYEQQMADLPLDRITPGPPFSSVGVDTFGPWEVVTRKTRGGVANSKRWAILFTCLTTRAIHIEVVDELSSSAFINALRRFVSLRGHVKVFRSDRGTNFVGATTDLKIDVINVDDSSLKTFLYNSGSVWIFNAPHSSHMGGVWERMIGVTRRILDSMLLTEKKGLTHDVLTTLMAEVCAIINSRPITAISSDPGDPLLLTPAMLLTMKRGTPTVETDSYSLKDMYRASWKHVQVLSDLFWTRWRKSYLQDLQSRRKWHSEKPNLKEGDVVLLRDAHSHRNNWPMGIVVNAIKSDDGLVRKAVVRVSVDGKIVNYTRPVCELILLID